MLIYQIAFKKKAAKELQSLPRKVVVDIANSIDGLAKEPRPHGSKKLKGSTEDLWRIRIGAYRVIYAIDDMVRIVSVRRIGHRRNIYR